MYRSLKSFYFSLRKNYSLSEDFIIDEFVFGDEKIDFRLLTNSENVGIEELVVLDKELHEIFNGREVKFSVQTFSKNDCPYKYFYYLNYDEFVNEVQKLLKNHGFSLTNNDRINFLEDYIEIYISNSLCRFKLLSNFDFYEKKYKCLLENKEKYYTDFGKDSIGNITRMDNLLDKIPENLEKEEVRLENYREEFSNAKEEVNKPFEKADLLLEKIERLSEVNKLIEDGMKEKENIKEKEDIQDLDNDDFER